MEMTGASPPLLCSCRAVAGKGTQQVTSLKHRTWDTHTQHQDKAIPQGCVMLLASPLPGGASLIPLGIPAQLGNDHSTFTKTQAWDMAQGTGVRTSLWKRDNLNSLYRKPFPSPSLCGDKALQTFQLLG